MGSARGGGRPYRPVPRAGCCRRRTAVIDAHEAIGNATTQADFEAAVAGHTAAVAALDDREMEAGG